MQVNEKLLKNEQMKKVLTVASKLETKSKKLISTYNSGYIGKKVYEVTLNDGSTRICEQITKHDGGDGNAVVILPITNDGNFVMIVQSRPNTKETVALQFPAGMVDEDEEWQRAAERELLEETGYKAEKIYELGWDYQDDGCSAAIIKTYVAEGCRKITEKRLDGEERLEEIELNPKLVEELILGKSPMIHDKNSKGAFMEYKLKKMRNDYE